MPGIMQTNKTGSPSVLTFFRVICTMQNVNYFAGVHLFSQSKEPGLIDFVVDEQPPLNP